ncbi:MAG TPA: DUF4893 domain-containing protein [Longimicrobiaceae bacterium]
MTVRKTDTRARSALVHLTSPGWLLAGLLFAACAVSAPPDDPREQGGEPEVEDARGWSAVITEEDRERLNRLPEAWTTALAQAREAGFGDELSDLGELVNPNTVLPDPAPPPGSYRCRTIKLGTQSDLLAFVSYGWFGCRVTQSGDTLRLEKVSGSQRQQGTLYPNDDRRLMFLGTVTMGSGEGPGPAYGTDPERDVVGVMERFAPERWRLVQPWPHFESVLDLLELVPVSTGAAGEG